jgi:hypothetical protein
VADVQLVTLYLPDGTPMQVVDGSALHATLIASGAGTSPVTRSNGTGPVWYLTPFGPQSIAGSLTQAEFERRGYPEISTEQAAAYFADPVAGFPALP